MIKQPEQRKTLWKCMFLIGLSAVTISASAMMSFAVLLFCGMVGLLVFDAGKNKIKTPACAFFCVLPNVLYMLLYVLISKGVLHV